MDVILQFYAEGYVEIPRDGDYEAWDSFKADPKRLGRDRKLLYYHPFQILRVKNILTTSRFRSCAATLTPDRTLKKSLTA